MHRMVEKDGLLFLGGVIADDLTQDMAGQTREICAKLDTILSEVGSSRTGLLSATIFVTDMNGKNQTNGVWMS